MVAGLGIVGLVIILAVLAAAFFFYVRNSKAWEVAAGAPAETPAGAPAETTAAAAAAGGR